MPPESTVDMNAVVVLAALATSLLVGVLAGLYTTLRAGRFDLRSQLVSPDRHGPDRGSSRIRRGLVVAQVAAAMILLAASTLLMRQSNGPSRGLFLSPDIRLRRNSSSLPTAARKARTHSGCVGTSSQMALWPGCKYPS